MRLTDIPFPDTTDNVDPVDDGDNTDAGEVGDDDADDGDSSDHAPTNAAVSNASDVAHRCPSVDAEIVIDGSVTVGCVVITGSLARALAVDGTRTVSITERLDVAAGAPSPEEKLRCG
jgi:hypothetical protein